MGQVLLRSQVLEQHQAARTVGRMDMRHVHAAALEQRGHLQERRDVLLVGRGVHHHARHAVRQPGAKVTSEAGIGRGRLEPDQAQAEFTGQPIPQLLDARVAACH